MGKTFKIRIKKKDLPKARKPLPPQGSVHKSNKGKDGYNRKDQSWKEDL
jgi:hypothetical protein